MQQEFQTAAPNAIEGAATPVSISEAETLVHEVRRLLVYSESAMDDDSVKIRAETLERWLESYRRGLSAAQKISRNSESFLQEMRNRLKLSLEEMQRLDDEGGSPATAEQKQRMDELAKAIRRIDHLTTALGEATCFKLDEPETV